MEKENLKERIDLVYNTLKDFQEKFLLSRGIEKKNILICGSLALALQDIPIEDVHDIDLEIKCSKEQEEIFKLLSDLNQNKFYEEKEINNYDNITWEHKPYIFKVDQIFFNVWVVKEFSHKKGLILGNGFNIAGVSSVLKRKLSYKRNKDYKYMNYLINQLTELLTKES